MSATERHPLAVELLVPADARRLAVALDRDARPWPSSREEDLAAMERQLEAEAQGPPQTRKKSEVSRVLALLDEIGKEGRE